jgi:phosphoribosylformimino-5-aminoimidazole carboxamide ribotide isomerase
VKIIPVIDVLNGVAVHAVRGRRKDYRPLESVLSSSSDPLEVAKAFKRLGFGEVYVADLNAITGNRDNFDVIKRIAEETGLRLMVDAGTADVERAKNLLQKGASRVIVGTETLTDICFVEEAVRLLGADCIVVSLDLRNGQVLAKFSLAKFPNAVAVMLEFLRNGVNQVIVLDLARVGSEEGADFDFLSLQMLNDMGDAGVLLATALHSGKITVDQLVAAGLTFT